MTESFKEQVERVIQMSEDSGETWDLSANDQAALKAVLLRLSALRELAAKWRKEAAGYPVWTDTRALAAASAVKLCADELEAAIASQLEPSTATSPATSATGAGLL